MITKITSIQELKQMFLEILLNKTDKISDISEESVLNGIAYGCAKLAQKCLVNQSVIEGHIFPDTSYGEYLDALAAIRGVAPRRGASGSSTYVRLVADVGTMYDKDVNYLTATNGVRFSLEESVTIGINGFAYVKVKSQSVGANTNVDPVTINNISPIPQGHLNVTNEYRASGGSDQESDELFRQRIKESINQLSRTTLSYLEQVFIKINPKVLKIFKGGTTADGKLNIIVVAVNGQDFTQQEFDEILSRSNEYLSLIELYTASTETSLKLLNVDWYPVDIDFRVDLDPAYNVDEVRRNMQIQVNKLFDYRYWKPSDKVEWENILFTIKNVEGVRYVPDNRFYPQRDIIIPQYRLPRVRGFMMRDMNGNIIASNNGVMSDVYYPETTDYNYTNSVLSNI